MPCLIAPIDGNGQLLANVWVTAHTAGNAEVEAAVHGRADGSSIRPCRALLDTGANKSCITEGLAKSLSLDIQGIDGIRTASETTQAYLYRVNIHIPFEGKEIVVDGKIGNAIDITQWLNVQVAGIPVSPTFEVLLGIDFIRQGALHVSGQQFTFCV